MTNAKRVPLTSNVVMQAELLDYMNFIIELSKGYNIAKSDQLGIYILGIIEETGEISGKLKKELRDNSDNTEELKKEIGDLTAYLLLALRFVVPIYRIESTIIKEIVADMNPVPYYLNACRADSSDVYLMTEIQKLQSEITSSLFEYSQRTDLRLYQVIYNVARILTILDVLADFHETSLIDCLHSTKEKLEQRRQKGTLHGSGDNR